MVGPKPFAHALEREREAHLFQLGIKHLYKATKEDNLEAQRLLRLAIAHDEGLAQAYAYLSYAILLSMLYFDAEPEETRLEEALELARKATEIDDRDAMIRFVHGRVLLARRAYDDALDELEQAVGLNPALAIGYCGVADSLTYEGRYEEAFPHFQHAIELSPHDPQRWAFLAYRAMAHLFARQFRLAADWAQKATRVPNCHYWPYSHRVAALGHLGATEEMKTAVEELLERKPGFSCEAARKRLFYIKNSDQIDIYLDNPAPIVGGPLTAHLILYPEGALVTGTDVQNFASDIVGERKSKGVIITTGFFAPEVATLPELPPMEFIDGKRLAELMKQHGVSPL